MAWNARGHPLQCGFQEIQKWRDSPETPGTYAAGGPGWLGERRLVPGKGTVPALGGGLYIWRLREPAAEGLGDWPHEWTLVEGRGFRQGAGQGAGSVRFNSVNSTHQLCAKLGTPVSLLLLLCTIIV